MITRAALAAEGVAVVMATRAAGENGSAALLSHTEIAAHVELQ
jgi:hypothetical protein